MVDGMTLRLQTTALMRREGLTLVAAALLVGRAPAQDTLAPRTGKGNLGYALA